MAQPPGRHIRRTKFRTRQVIEASRETIRRAFDLLGRDMQAAVHAALATPYPPASRPGEKPHRRTGYLQSNSIVRREGLSLLLRTPQYGLYLESGTKKPPKGERQKAAYARAISTFRRVVTSRSGRVMRVKALRVGGWRMRARPWLFPTLFRKDVREHWARRNAAYARDIGRL